MTNTTSHTQTTNILRILKKHRRLFFFIVSIIFLCSFFLFSIVVRKHLLTQFDFNMSVHLQDDTPLKLYKIYQLFSWLASIQVMIVILAIILLFRKKIIQGIVVLSIFLSSHIVELFGKIFIHHPPPPFMFYKHLDVSAYNFSKYYVQTGNSYPSGHSFRAVFVAIIFIYTIWQIKRFPRLFRILLSLGACAVVIAVCVSKVSLGEHWTSDVIGGALFGLASAMFSLILL